jgi:hypothetical protein
MKAYSFYLYGDDGALIGPASADLDCDQSARTLAGAILDGYPGCHEIEIWERLRYVGQSRKPHGAMPREKAAARLAPRLVANNRLSAQRGR